MDSIRIAAVSQFASVLQNKYTARSNNSMLFLSFLLVLPTCLAAAKPSSREKLAAMAAANNGVVKLDSETYNLITSPTRDWSAAIQLTALHSFKCAPCKCVSRLVRISTFVSLMFTGNLIHRSRPSHKRGKRWPPQTGTSTSSGPWIMRRARTSSRWSLYLPTVHPPTETKVSSALILPRSFNFTLRPEARVGRPMESPMESHMNLVAGATS